MERRPASAPPDSAEEPRTVFIACAALGREVRAIVRKYGWKADVQSIDAKLHLYPKQIEHAVEVRLEQTEGRYERRIVVYGHCGAFNLDAILERSGAVRPLGPHCYEMYGGERFAQALQEEPGTFFLTDFLVRAWEALVVRGLKLDRYPKLQQLLFGHYRRLVYYSQEEDEQLVERAREIADWLGLPLRVEHVGYGELERRLVAIMAGREQPVSALTHDGYSASAYPVAG